MPKRKAIDEPQLWKVNGLYLFPLSEQQYATVEFRKFRQIYPNTKVCFLKNATCPIQAILSELLDPSQFKEKDSHYYIAPARLMAATTTTIKLGKYTVTWMGDHAECLGSCICDECFMQSKLYPHTCPVHLRCSHGKKRVRNCSACVAGTLLGFWQERLLCYQGTQESLFTVSRGTNAKSSFKCLECKHLFEISGANMFNGKWCPFCAHRQLCDDASCHFCHLNSFASNAKSQFWDCEKNANTPRQVFKNTRMQFWFCCHVCSHKFQSTLNNISHDCWCPFCANQKLCLDTTCQSCFYNSFASSEKAQFWNIPKNDLILPRNVFRCSNMKYWFTCAICLHNFDTGLNTVTNQGNWCPFCAHKLLCVNPECKSCSDNSFASSAKSNYWHVTKNAPLMPRQVFKQSNEKYWFFCDVCSHDFQRVISDVTQKWGCPFCSHHQLCSNMLCQCCNENSFASHKKSQYWHVKKNVPVTPRQIFKHSNEKYWFSCDVCAHDFQSVVNDVTQNRWCPFCSSYQLCSDMMCQSCNTNSFANNEKSYFWHPTKNGIISPRHVFKHSHDKYWFNCAMCSHDFQSALSDVSRGRWCGFCGNRQLCLDPTCQSCSEKCFASSVKSAFWHPTKNGTVLPQHVFKYSHDRYWFNCANCSHDFQIVLSNVSYKEHWCPYCSYHQRCNAPTCKTCAQSCDVCKSKKAQTKTRISRTWVCWQCLDDAISRDPNETPLMQRARISLEILMLAELQRQAILEGNYFISEPTSWDCAVLPGLNFKPDCMWCFDENGDVIYLGNVSKLNLNEIKYVLHLEILEDSRAAHSKARGISDEDREIDIRKLYGSQQIPMGCLYVTVAHKKHLNAHPDDVFFTKPDQEYEVIPAKTQAWEARVQEVYATLVKMVQEKSNTTVYIGY